eukprot:CAMPEP_0197859452 /NCGR_PEP_ID=MMETSP1438-20131217/34022_1 /TAXON_ID=1461541 /ORGANISM="Pterosperma sp., Strain CCMP1384" /LENGTH=144 /DNA_ID=CAMNT_0043475939 /DNA_START=211 /DNA_END=642 /DNA_ORIENTATION=-
MLGLFDWCCGNSRDQRVADPLEEYINAVRPASSFTDVATAGDKKTATAREINNLPLEEYYSPEEFSNWKVKALKDELKRLQTVQRNAPSTIPIEKSELIAAVVEARGGSSGNTCAVCYCEYDPEEVVRVLPCGHRFHIECIDRW